MKRRVTWFVASFILVLVMVLVSCAPATPTQTQTPTPTSTATLTPTPTSTPGKEMVKDFMGRLVEKPQYGGVLRVDAQGLTFGDTLAMDPALGASNSHRVIGLIHERLGIGDWAKGPAGTNEISFKHVSWFGLQYGKGHLAESWEQPDDTTVIVHIRKGIHYQNKPPANGRELNAEDVAYCFNRYIKTPGAPMDMRSYLLSVTATDKWTVEFKLKSPYCEALREILYGRVYIYPPELVQTGIDRWQNHSGTGPFMLVDYVVGSAFTFEKNPNYWCTDEIIPGNRLPYVDTVTALIITDKATKMAALRTGKLDLTTTESDMTPDQAIEMRKTNPELKYSQAYAADVRPLVHVRCDEPPFNNLKVRQALCMAINYQEIVNTYFRGEAIILSAPVWPEWKDLYVPIEEMPADIKELYSYNPTKAKQLLSEAGYPNGLQVEFLVTNVQDIMERAQILQQYWKAVGIDAKITVQEFSALLSRLWAMPKDYHGIAAFSGGVTGAVTILNWSTTSHTYNWPCYYDPAYDAKVADLMRTMDGQEQNKKIKELVQYQYRNCIELRFPMAYTYHFWCPWLKGYDGELCIGGVMGLEPIYARLWIDQAVKKSRGY